MDNLTKEKRSKVMSSIRSADTKPELLLRKLLHAQGFRFRLHGKGLPGRPDIILPKHNAVILVHGCFWHNHQGCKYSHVPETRTSYWKGKLQRNKERDKGNVKALTSLGLRVAVVWECSIKEQAQEMLEQLTSWIADSGQGSFEY